MPQQGEAAAPYGTLVQFSCSVIEGYRIEWSITLPEKLPVRTSSTTDLVRLQRQGISVVTVSDRASRLVVNGTSRNNRTQAICISINIANPNSTSSSDEVEVRIGMAFEEIEINFLFLVHFLHAAPIIHYA